MLILGIGSSALSTHGLESLVGLGMNRDSLPHPKDQVQMTGVVLSGCSSMGCPPTLLIPHPPPTSSGTDNHWSLRAP